MSILPSTTIANIQIFPQSITHIYFHHIKLHNCVNQNIKSWHPLKNTHKVCTPTPNTTIPPKYKHMHLFWRAWTHVLVPKSNIIIPVKIQRLSPDIMTITFTKKLHTFFPLEITQSHQDKCKNTYKTEQPHEDICAEGVCTLTGSVNTGRQTVL